MASFNGSTIEMTEQQEYQEYSPSEVDENDYANGNYDHNCYVSENFEHYVNCTEQLQMHGFRGKISLVPKRDWRFMREGYYGDDFDAVDFDAFDCY